MTLEVVHRHEKLAPESGVEFMAPISGACVRALTLTSTDVKSNRPSAVTFSPRHSIASPSIDSVDHSITVCNKNVMVF